MINNLKLSVNVAVNKLDIFTKIGGTIPNIDNPIKIAIPDGNGFTLRMRNSTILSGTSQFILTDTTNYWSKGSLDGEIKNCWLYAIWDGNGIIWALAGYSGFTMVPTTTTATDDDYFLLEESSTYSRSNSHYCVAIAKIRYQYDTTDTPNYTIQTTVVDAPQIIWNPKSDYSGRKSLAVTITSSSDITEYSVLSIILKQSGKYFIQTSASVASVANGVTLVIKAGSATYSSAIQKASTYQSIPLASDIYVAPTLQDIFYVNVGDTIHFGIGVTATSGNRRIRGDDNQLGATKIIFDRIG